MYITYIYSYQFLKAYQVAIFTIFTPLFVTLINDLFEKRFHLLFLAVAILAIIGTAIIVNRQIHQSDIRIGFFLVQVSNICFALGQVWYKKIMGTYKEIKDANIFGLLYFGAFIITFIAALSTTEWSTLQVSTKQVLTLLYLGAVASGFCFFLWNYGAKKTDIGALAIFNNMKVPLAVACSILFFHEKGNIPRLLIGGVIILVALFINEWLIRKKTAVINGKN
jgi:drug/metabolite transporter (DMT)-like permease